QEPAHAAQGCDAGSRPGGVLRGRGARRPDRADAGAHPARRCRASQAGRDGTERSRRGRRRRVGARRRGGAGTQDRQAKPQAPHARMTTARPGGRRTRKWRVVLDTNVVVSALLFTRGATVRLREAWQAGEVLPLASRATAAELVRVLAYP